jgi:hypothetical protein
VSTLATNKPNGITTLRDIIIAPASAFSAIAERPTWVVALVVTIVCSIAVSIVISPALVHMFQVWFPTQMTQDPRLAAMSPDDRASAMSMGLNIARYGYVVSSLFVGILAAFATAIFLFVVARASKSEITFSRCFSLAMNVAVINFALQQIVTGAIVLFRGPDAFSAPLDFTLSTPDLGWLAPSAPPKLVAFLATINPFSIWSLLLLGAGMAAIARLDRKIAYTAAAVVTLCTSAFAAFGAR